MKKIALFLLLSLGLTTGCKYITEVVEPIKKAELIFPNLDPSLYCQEVQNPDLNVLAACNYLNTGGEYPGDHFVFDFAPKFQSPDVIDWSKKISVELTFWKQNFQQTGFFNATLSSPDDRCWIGGRRRIGFIVKWRVIYYDLKGNLLSEEKTLNYDI
jgi:hypothetical protein